MESDKEKESREANPQAANVEDLAVAESESDQVSGGTTTAGGGAWKTLNGGR